MIQTPLNIFYEEPNPDRWFPFDRYPREIIRRIFRGKPRPGGVMMVALELMRGLDKIGVPYRFNDYKYIKAHPNELACVIGKPQLIFEKRIPNNPILFGAGIYSHPIECPDLFEKYPNVKKCLVPGEWMRQMFVPYYGEKVLSWPVGIDTEKWITSANEKTLDVLVYDKIRWEHDHYNSVLLQPIIDYLEKNKLTYSVIKYGSYKQEVFLERLKVSKSMIFLCEHETQGLAYQQVLSCNVPIFAWERGGYWKDPAYYPDRVKYEPVSSVPYWDERCGMKFKDFEAFENRFDTFFEKVETNTFSPRKYILEKLTLEKCAEKYVEIVKNLTL